MQHLEIGKILKGKVTGITNFGAFVELENGVSGLVHISEISNDYVKDINDHIKVGQVVDVKVLPNDKKDKLGLSIKQAVQGNSEQKPKKPREKKAPYQPDFHKQPVEFSVEKNNNAMSFDDMLNKFKQSSEEKMHDIKRNLESKRGTGKKGGANNY